MARIKSLGAGLAAKAEELRLEEQRQKEAAVSFIEAARRAEQQGGTAEKHAEAVEKAFVILTDAGVAL